MKLVWSTRRRSSASWETGSSSSHIFDFEFGLHGYLTTSLNEGVQFGFRLSWDTIIELKLYL